MLAYKCRVLNNLGEVEELIIEADSVGTLKLNIENRGLTYLSSQKSSKRTGLKLKKDELLLFTNTLNLLINSNLSLNDSIQISKTSLKQKRLQSLLNKISIGLHKGDTLVDILNKSVTGLPPLYIGLVHVGEKTGNLRLILNQLSRYLEREKKYRDKLIGAMIYPIFIAVITFIFSILFVLIILPKFNEMFLTLGGGLGDVLKNRGDVLTHIIYAFLTLSIGIITHYLYIRSIKKNDYTRAVKYDKFILKIPFIGKQIIENETFNIVFALSVLTKSSLGIGDSLLYGKEVVSNAFIRSELKTISKSIISGKKLSESFSKSIFPSKVASFIRVGEKTGDIGTVLTDLSEYYSKESDMKVERFMSIIDPIFTLLVGGILFSLILLFILPVLTQIGELM